MAWKTFSSNIFAYVLFFNCVNAIDVAVNNQTVHLLSPSLYGVFFEEINFAGEGGLFAELIRNRDFEALGRGNLGETSITPTIATDPTPTTPSSFPPASPEPEVTDPVYTSYVPWVGQGGAVLATDNTTHPFATNPTTLRVAINGSGAVANPGYWGINCVSKQVYDLTFFARSSNAVPVVPSLQTGTGLLVGEGTVVTVSGDWQQYKAVITGISSYEQAQFVLSIEATATIWLDSVSLRPREAVGGVFRPDLFQKLLDLKPAFVRFPGGNYLEGDEQAGPTLGRWQISDPPPKRRRGKGKRARLRRRLHPPSPRLQLRQQLAHATRWDWKATIGQMEARPGHYNSAWGYWSSDGLGLYEFLLLCEFLKAQPQMSVYTGYSMKSGYVPLNMSQPFAQDALDALEFANGGADTKFGAIRVAMGHPGPFNLSRLEVGNEESNMAEYATHYKLITSQIWAKYPDVQIVASGCWNSQNVGVCQPGNPCTSGQRCDAWDDHLYECPDILAQVRSSQYDNYDRKSPKVFKGEFAANSPPWLQCADVPPQGPLLQNLQAALAEAAYMIGFERNADVVLTASFAPLFCSEQGTQWPYNLINFNTATLFGIPSYYVQTVFTQYLGHHTIALNTSQAVGNVTGWALASVAQDGSLFLKLVNYSPQPVFVNISFTNFSPAISTIVSSVVLTGGDRRAVNSFEDPLNVIPRPGPAPPLSSGLLQLTLPAWSLSALALR